MPTNAIFTQIAAMGGGSLTVNNCSFSGKVGKVDATLKVLTPIGAVTTPYVITFTFQ